MVNNERVQLMIVESLPQVMKQVQKLCDLMENVVVVSMAKTAQEAITAIRDIKPDVALIDVNLSDMNGINLTEIVRRDFPATQVIVISQDKYYDTVIRAMRNGAADFVTHDVTLEELNLAIQRSGEMAAAEKQKGHPYVTTQQKGEGTTPAEETGSRGSIVAVYSPKGGTGVTTIAVNLALALLDNETTVGLVDGSIQYGDVGVLLNEMGKFSMMDLISHIYEMDTKVIDDVMLIHKPTGLRILAAPTRPEMAEKVTGNNMAQILEMMRTMFNYVVVNTSSYISDPALASMDVADTVILVSSQEIAALKNTLTFLELWDGFGLTRDRIVLVLNKFDKKKGLDIDRISQTLKHPVALTIPIDEETILRAANLGLPFVLNKKDAAVTKCIRSIADIVRTKVPEPASEERQRLFSLA